MAKYYYDRLKTVILPRNADVNMIVGARGLGKTYGMRKYMIEDYLKTGIVLRKLPVFVRKTTMSPQTISTVS